MIKHKISLTNETCCPCEIYAGTKGSYGIHEIEFDFSDIWNGLAKKVSFYPPRSASVVVVMTGDDTTIAIPQEATSKSGECVFIVEGIATGQVILTVRGTLVVDDTNTPADTPAGSPTATEIEQLYAAIAEKVATQKGDDGDDGVTFTPAVSSEGVISWTNNGNAANPESVNIKGPKGDTGATGGTEFPEFYIDTADMCLYVTYPDSGSDVTFSVDEDGCLCSEVTA